MIGDRILKRPMGALRKGLRAFLRENGSAESPAKTFQGLTASTPMKPDPLSLIGSVWSGSGADNMILIAGLARAGRAKRYLEIGAYRGFTAGFVRWACPEIEIHAIDNWQRANTNAAALIAGVQQISGTSHNIFTHEGDSTRQLDKLIGLGLRFDLIYVDGCHTYDYAKGDYQRALQLLEPTGTIVIDDTVTWWGPRELSEELQSKELPANFHLLEIQTTNGLLILRRQPPEKAPLALTRENCPDGVWHDEAPTPSRAKHVS
jgi:predicted O-methyltransferase YrrM